MKLVFYSGGAKAANRTLHTALADLTPRRRGRSITYIPFCADGALGFFRRFERRYRPYGFTSFHCLPIDLPYTATDLARALTSDAIYLAGGNTFYFLHHLKKGKLLRKLRAFARQGGVLAGLSAGAHILTPTIELAAYPPEGADENDVRLRDLRALNLVPFEFFPHYVEQKTLRQALAHYSTQSRRAVVAAADGGGVVVEGQQMTFVGRSELFLAGAHGRLT